MAAARVLDVEFIAQHTHGFEDFATTVREAPWPEIEHRSGLTRGAIEAAARASMRAPSAMIAYGMGLTQHVGRRRERADDRQPAAAARQHRQARRRRAVRCAVTRMCRASARSASPRNPKLVPNDKLKELYGFEPPRDKGLQLHVEACEGDDRRATCAQSFSLAAISCASLPDHDASWSRPGAACG